MRGNAPWPWLTLQQQQILPRQRTSPSPVLSVRELQAWYGESHILHGMSFDLYPGEVVTLLGRNGAGKTTTLRSIIGILSKRSGSILFEGTQTIGLPSRSIARLGIGYCPEERGILFEPFGRGKPHAAPCREAGRALA